MANARWRPLNHMYLQETAMFYIVTEIMRQLASFSQLNKLVIDSHPGLMALENFLQQIFEAVQSKG